MTEDENMTVGEYKERKVALTKIALELRDIPTYMLFAVESYIQVLKILMEKN